MSTILKIRNLECSYNQKDIALKVQYLDIESGKVVFILGSSGSGKGTLLETMGLMNNTFHEGSVTLPGTNGHEINFADLWKNNKQKEIDHIRKNNLSFIFQNTNLMENFTAYENICLSQMIKAEVNQSIAMEGAVDLMQQVGLPETEVSRDKLSVNLSGGQRQRVAFVRALNNNFKLLLCDEPTGNLDEVNANELINIIKRNVKNNSSAILVSHDVNLALKYADQIILITKNNREKFGEILQENIFNRAYWEKLSEEKYQEFRSTIVRNFTSDTSAKDNETQATNKQIELNTYKELFIKKESKILFGKTYANLSILSIIVFITLLAVGFANGALEYVDRKLNDTFVNWVIVPIPVFKSEADNVEKMLAALNEDKIKKEFLLNSVTTFKVTSLRFFENNSNESDFVKGRLVSENDPLLVDIFNTRNFVSGNKKFNGIRDLGIIVTSKFLAKYKYPQDANVIYLDITDTLESRNEPFKVPIAIRAVVREIPGKNNFIATDFFFNSYRITSECVFDYREQNKRILIYCKNKEDAKSLKAELTKAKLPLHETYTRVDEEEQSFLDYEDISPEGPSENEVSETTIDSDSNNNLIDSLQTEQNPKLLEQDIALDYMIDSCEQISDAGYQLSINLDPQPENPLTTERINKAIFNLSFVKNNQDKFTRIFDDGIAPEVINDIRSDYFSINFNKGGLDKIEPFAKFMNQNLNSGNERGDNNTIEMDYSAIKEKNNFSYLSKITILIIALLIIFAIISINLFISNLLKSHLNKVKMNLGTYKAFGLSDKVSQRIYQLIMLRFIFFSIIIGGICAFAGGYLISLYFEKTVAIDDEINYFKLFSWQTGALILLLVIVTWFVSQSNIKKILSKTPGDLIYNR